jgi:predicted peptidase
MSLELTMAKSVKSPGTSLDLVAMVFAAMILLLSGHPHAVAQDSQEAVLERTYTTKLTYRYIVTLPDEYAADEDRAWPLVLFLHGGGSPQPEALKRSTRWLTDLPAIIVTPICPPSPDGPIYANWDWRILGELVRKISEQYRVDPELRSVIGFSMGGSGAWELPFYEPELFTKSVVIAGVCHPWSQRHYPKIPVWVFVGADDYMRKEQQETVTSAERFGVDVVETVWTGADHGGIFRKARTYQPMLNWLVTKEDLRVGGEIGD